MLSIVPAELFNRIRSVLDTANLLSNMRDVLRWKSDYSKSFLLQNVVKRESLLFVRATEVVVCQAKKLIF